MTTILYNNKAKLLICCFFLSLSFFSFSQQNKIDSLLTLLKTDKEDTTKVTHLNWLANELIKSNYDTAMVLATQSLNLSENIITNADKGSDLWVAGQIGRGDSYLLTGRFYYRKGDNAAAYEKYHKGLDLLESIEKNIPENKKNQVRVLESKFIRNIGIIYKNQGNYRMALDYYFKTLKMTQELNDSIGIESVLGNIGIVYKSLADYPKALDYHSRALKMAETQNDKEGIARHHINLGIVYSDQGDYFKALDYYFKSLKMAEELESKRSMRIAMENIGNAYEKLNDYTKALDYYLKTLKIDEELGNKSDVARSLGNTGSIYLKTGDFSKAEQYLTKALSNGDSLGIMEFEKSLSQLYDTTDRYQLAYEHYKIYSQLKDSLFTIEKDKDITRKEINYEFEKKEAATKAEQDKQIAVAAAIKKRELIKLASVVGGLFLLLAVLGAIIRSLKIARKQKSIIEKQKFTIEKKQKEIVESIHYGKRIQKAVITSHAYIKQHLKRDFFILFKPKDIVSGDFYWALQHHHKFYMITADSTGHGVPGAFMSLLNISFLNEAIVERGIKEPHEVLNYVREEVIKAINPVNSGTERRDGMDAVLCCYDFEKMELNFAAANNPLWLFRNGEITEYKPDKMPVGKYSEETKSFTLQTIALQHGDIVYTITDGYADQFGGADNKKLGKKTLRNKLSENSIKSMPEQKEILLKTFNDWKGGQEQIDDVSVMGVKI